MQPVNDTQLAILEAVGRFHYLTTTQMMDWGITRNKRHLYAVLQQMEGKTSSPLKKMNYGAIAGVGRLHSLYHLSRRGADILTEAGVEHIQYPDKPVMFTRDYFHRVESVDIHLSFEKWARGNGGEVKRFDTYYDRTGRSLRGHPAPKTTIRWATGQLTPDAVTELVGTDGLSRLCAIELHRGRDMLRLDKQIIQYASAIETAALEHAYDYKAAGRVLIVFTQADALETCKRRIQALGLSDGVMQRLFLNTLDGIKLDVIDGWQTVTGQSLRLF